MNTETEQAESSTVDLTAAYLDICGHIVTTSEVVGIGPLFKNQKSDAISSMYGSTIYEFTIHFRNHTAKVISTQYALASQEGREDARRYIENYNRCREAVINLIIQRHGSQEI